MVHIQLIDTVKGILDVKEGTNFPITFGVADIRDITRRTGVFSKTITLVGNKNNNQLLGHIYDINLTEGTFNINKLQKCQVIEDGVIIKDNMYFQLISVNKIQKTSSHDEFVEYEAIIKDSVGDFFTKINQKELSEIDIDDLSYSGTTVRRLRVSEITSSFNNTVTDGFKFVMPWLDPLRTTSNPQNETNTYSLQEIKPAVYAKVYWDRIFSNAGYTYTWDGLDDQFIRFDKLLMPYNGDEKQMLPEIQSQYEVQLTGDTTSTLTFNITSATDEGGIGKRIYTSYPNLNTEIKDLEDQWNTGTQVYTSALSYSNPNNGLLGELVADFKLELINNESVNIETFSPFPDFQNDILLSPTWKIYKFNGVTPPAPYTNLFQYGDGSVTTIPYGQEYSPGATTLFNETVSIGKVIDYYRITGTLSQFALGLFIRSSKENFSKYLPFWIKSTTPIAANYSYRITFSNIRFNLKPSLNAVDYLLPVLMNGYRPLKVKQTDFIASISQMYNLFFEPNPDDQTNIIIKTRDEYYDDGNVKDWTKKLVKDDSQNIQFLPELTSKKLTLSYKDDNDVANTTYKNATLETYGQVEVVYDNEYIKGSTKKELLFSPTPVAKTNFDVVAPVVNGYNPKSNPRLLLDNGYYENVNYYILENGEAVSLNTNFPKLSHFGSDDYYPDFDINYGACDYYFYNLPKVTNNNLFNLHWRRTYQQINDGKLLSANFILKPSDIRNLKLNDKIRIDNSYWNINKVIDYNSGTNTPTKVELISVDDNLVLSPFITREVKQPIYTDTQVSLHTNWQKESRNGFSNNVNVIGYDNSISPQSTGIITGNNNILSSQYNLPTTVNGDNNVVTEGSTVIGYGNTVETSAFIIGSNNTVPADALNVTLLGVNDYTITTGSTDTVYLPKNLVFTQTGGTINGVPLVDITNAAIVDISHTDLRNKVLLSELVVGTFYKITDFQTIYDQPDYDATGTPKIPITLSGPIIPILVQAISINELSSEAYGYPGVIKMGYDIFPIATEVNGSPMKGRINYMLDTSLNESYYDHQTILFKRYETINGSGVYDNWRDTGFASTSLITFTGYNNKIKLFENWVDFRLANNIIVGDNNTLEIEVNNTTIFGVSNKIGTDSSNILINGDYNKVDDSCVGIYFNGNNTANEVANGSTGLGFDTGTSQVKLSQTLNGVNFNSSNNTYEFNRDLHNVPLRTVTTTNATTTDLYTFTPNGDGVWGIETVVNGYEPATTDTIVAKGFAAFKVIGGVVTQISTSSIDRKSNFPAGVTITLDTNGTLIRLRVTGRTGSSIIWKGHITITK